MPRIGDLPDAMSDVLSLVRMRGELVCASKYSTPWAFSFRKPVAHFHIIERGAAWIAVDGSPRLRLESGDLAVLPLGAGHVLSSEQGAAVVPIERAIAESAVREGLQIRLGGGGQQTHIVSGQFSFDGVLAPKLLTVLPPLMHIPATNGHPLEWLQLTSHFLVEETRHPKSGSAIMIGRLLDLLFVQAIREWGARNPSHLGWLSALRDANIGRSLSAIHGDPAQGWTVERLAGVAGLSRSAFAARFSALVGQTPLKYLATWRLYLAADHLRAGSLNVSEVAALVGYGSEAALNRAFKAQFGTTPGAFRVDGFALSRRD